MSDKYINPSGLAHYDEKIKEVIDGKGKILNETKGDTLYYDEQKSELQLKSGENVLSTVTIVGGNGGSGEENTIDSISVNGVNVPVDENKNVDITVPSIEGLTKDADLSTVAKSGSYEDLINKPTIPDITGLATETYVDNKVADYTKTVDLADVATSGSYNDLADKPTIPSLDGYAKTSEIPSKVSELENDSNYLSSIPEEYVTETELEAKGYLTSHQDISGKVDKVKGKSLIADTEIERLKSVKNYDDTEIKTELAKKANSTDVTKEISDKIAEVVSDAPESFNTLKEISDWIAGHEDDASAMNSAISDNKTAITALQTGKADKNEIPTIPTLISSFTNDKGYMTEFTETDPTVPAWAKTENKPSYTAAEVGALPEDTEIPIFINKTVLDGITAEKVENWDEAVTTKTALEAHTNSIVSSETGAHGMRYFNGTLQVQNEAGEWVDIESGGGGIAPNNVSDINLKTGNTKLTISWSDPSDTIIEGQTLSTWKGTKLVQKVGSFPENPKDGTLILDNQTRDKYKTNGFEITGLTNGETYYFALFPYSDTGAVNTNVANRTKGTPQPFRTMTVRIDLTNSNPLSSVTYADDAVGMTAGSSDWDDFIGQTPVLLDSSGNELGNLKVSDYSKFEDGTSAPITTVGNDVMVKFPKRGLKISTSGNTISISMTDNPDAESEGFKYYAHSYGANNNCDEIYVGAYKAYVSSSKLYSSSGKTPTGNQTIGTFRTQANARGTGYEQMTFYVRTFLIAAYLLKYKHLNSQVAVGRGYVDGNSAPTTTGQTNTKGMDWGEGTGKYQCKCLGIEDLWGNINEWIDGIFSNSTRNILTKTTNNSMNDTGSGYQDNGQGATADIGNYMNEVQGTTEKGFVAKSVSGSATTYFCDYARLYASCIACAGGDYGHTDSAGVFRLSVGISASGSNASIGGRLIKFKTAE